jgi:hypothetical protein
MAKKITETKHKRIAALRALLTQTFELYDAINKQCVYVHREFGDMTPEELADVGFLLREAERMLDDARKEMAGRRETIGKKLCVAVTERHLQGGDLTVRTTLCTATPDIKQAPKLPAHGSPEYNKLMQQLGIPPLAAGLVSLHFVRLQTWLTKLAEDGKNVPVDIKSFPYPQVTYRKKS